MAGKPLNNPSPLHTLVFFFICIFFSLIAAVWELRHRFYFRLKVKVSHLETEELVSTLEDFQAFKTCRDPYIEKFQVRHRQEFGGANRLWIINSSGYWMNRYVKELRKRNIPYDLSELSLEEDARRVKKEIRSRIRKNGLLYEVNSLLGGYFGVFLEVRSLEFFLAWGRATRKPVVGKFLHRLFVWFSTYFTGIVVPSSAALHEQYPLIMPYDEITRMVKRARIARLQPCSCKSYFLPEEDIPRDSCMGFNYIEDLDELSREDCHAEMQNQEEVLAKLQECEKKGLIHQFMTVSRPTGKKGYVLCNCGESCIPVFLYLHYGIPMVRGSGLTVSITRAEDCTGCGQCLKRCIFKATTLSGGDPQVQAEKCLGCGLCVSTCTAGIRKLNSATGQGGR